MEILNLINQRDKLLKKFSQEHDHIKKSTFHTDYKQIRDLVTQKNMKVSPSTILPTLKKN